MAVKVEKQVSSQEIFSIPWLKIRMDKASIDETIEVDRIVVSHPGAAAILAITKEQKVILVSQYRYPTQQILYEIPAGKVDEWGGDYYATAQRELAEETPFTASDLQLIHTFYTAPGFCDEFMHLYKATDVVANSQCTPDEDEFVDIHLYSKTEVRALLAQHQIHDAKTLIALQYWLYADDK